MPRDYPPPKQHKLKEEKLEPSKQQKYRGTGPELLQQPTGDPLANHCRINTNIPFGYVVQISECRFPIFSFG